MRYRGRESDSGGEEAGVKLGKIEIARDYKKRFTEDQIKNEWMKE